MKMLVLAAIIALLAPLALHARTWTSSDGRKLEAEFVSADDKTVTIKRKDGRKFSLPLDKISEADREWIKTHLAEVAAEEEEAAARADKDNPWRKLVTGKWERGEEDGLKFRLYAERKLLRSKDKLYPVVVHLHGRGGNVMTPEEPGLAREFAKDDNYRKRPCFILVPQNPEGVNSWRGKPNATIVKIVEKLIKNLPVDKNRLYINGYSMGGFGTFDSLASEPKLWAAAVPVAGGGNPSAVKAYKKVPIWVFHGSADPTVDVEQSRKMVEAIEKARGKVEYTELEGEGHGIAGAVFKDEKLHEWIFAQSRS